MVLRSIVWDFAGRMSSIAVSLVITAVLSRLLSPHDYGILGLVMAVAAIASIFQDFGFGSAIVQRREIDERQLSTIFYLNACAGTLIYAVIFCLAPFLARFYAEPALTLVLRVSALTFLIAPLNLVPTALIQRRMMFKQQAVRNVLASVLVGSLAIFAAMRGWGVWSLVLQSLLSALIGFGINLWIVRWRPLLAFQLATIKPIFSYSLYIFLSFLANTLFTRLDVFLIGKVFSIGTLGQYTRAQGMDNIVRTTSSSSLNVVLFSHFSRVTEERALLQMWHKSFHMLCVSTFLAMGISYIMAPLAFNVMFGPRWSISGEYYRILCLGGFAYPISNLALSIVESRGMAKEFFEVEVIKKFVLLPTFFVAYFYGIKAYLGAYVVAMGFCLLLNMWYLRKAIPVQMFSDVVVILKYFSTIPTMLGCVWLVGHYLALGPALNAIVATALFLLLFALQMLVLSPESLRVLREYIVSFRAKRNAVNVEADHFASA